jgi:hypothetical protein
MDVEMFDRLAAVFAGVDHDAITLVEVPGASDFSRDPEQVSEQGTMGRFTLGEGGDVFARGHQHMNRSLRTEIGKGVAELVLVDGGGGDASFNDVAEEATHNANSVQERNSRESIQAGAAAGLGWRISAGIA